MVVFSYYLIGVSLALLYLNRIAASPPEIDYGSADERRGESSSARVLEILKEMAPFFESRLSLQDSETNSKLDQILDTVSRLEQQHTVVNGILLHSVSKIEERLTVLNFKVDNLVNTFTQLQIVKVEPKSGILNSTNLVGSNKSCSESIEKLEQSVTKLELVIAAHGSTTNSMISAVNASFFQFMTQSLTDLRGVQEEKLAVLDSKASKLVSITTELKSNSANQGKEIAKTITAVCKLLQTEILIKLNSIEETSMSNHSNLAAAFVQMENKRNEVTEVDVGIKVNQEIVSISTTAPQPPAAQIITPNSTPAIQPTAPCTFQLGHEFVKGYRCIAPGKGIFTFQEDGNLVIYSEHGQPKWDSGTGNNIGYRASFQSDGNLVVYDSNKKPRFATSTYGELRLVFQEDRNLVIYNNANRPVWSTRTHD